MIYFFYFQTGYITIWMGTLPWPPICHCKINSPVCYLECQKENFCYLFLIMVFFFFSHSDELICMLLSRRLPQEGIEFEMQIVEIITTWLHRSNSALFASVCFHDIIQKKQDRVSFIDYPQILSVSLSFLVNFCASISEMNCLPKEECSLTSHQPSFVKVNLW